MESAYIMELFKDGINALDQNYNNIRDAKSSPLHQARNLCNELWEIYEPYADSNFLDQIQKDFLSRFWEMDLVCMFLKRGYDISCPKPGPDICLKNGSSQIWIEAIAPGNGTGRDQVPEMKLKVAQSVPGDQITLRLTAAIKEKHSKYLEYLKNGVIRPDEPYVIAINGCKINFVHTDLHMPPRIVRAVYPIGSEYVTFERNTGQVVDRGFQFKDTVTKDSGAKIPTNIFLTQDCEGISAVLFSASSCCNRPQVPGADYILVHNLRAKNPIQEGVIKLGREWVPQESGECTYQLRWNDYSNA